MDNGLEHRKTMQGSAVEGQYLQRPEDTIRSPGTGVIEVVSCHVEPSRSLRDTGMWMETLLGEKRNC